MKTIILCADDYAQNPAISAGILQLIEKQRLTAVSCLVTANDWPRWAGALTVHQDKVDIGLHFNLTWAPLTTLKHAYSVKQLLLLSHLKRLSVNMIRAELEQQLSLFKQHMGKLPDFIDGHEHVHQFPQVRQVLIDVYQQQLRRTKPYLRVATPQGYRLKNMIIRHCGGKQLAQHARELAIPRNLSFSGCYDFAKAKHYPTIFPHFLQEISQQGLIMCHPGLASHDSADPLQHSRPEELAYFASSAFLRDLTRYKTRITQFKIMR